MSRERLVKKKKGRHLEGARASVERVRKWCTECEEHKKVAPQNEYCPNCQKRF